MTDEEWGLWHEHPLTQKAKKYIRNHQQERQGIYRTHIRSAKDGFELAVKDALSAGYIEALEWVLELGKGEKNV